MDPIQSVSDLNPSVSLVQRNFSLPHQKDMCCLLINNNTDCSTNSVLTAGISAQGGGSRIACIAISPGSAVVQTTAWKVGVGSALNQSMAMPWSSLASTDDIVRRQEQGNVVFPLIVFGVLTGVFLCSWLLSFLLDRRRVTDTEALREALYLRMGGMGPTTNLSSIPVSDTQTVTPAIVASKKNRSAIKPLAAAKADVEFHLTQLRKARSASIISLVLMHLAHTAKAFLMQHHAWFAVFARIAPDTTAARRPQRVALLCVLCVTSMAVCAVYYGADLRSLSGQAVTAVMAAAVLIPIEVGFALLFSLVNKMPSRLLRNELHEELLRRKRQQRRRARRVRLRIPLEGGAPSSTGGDGKQLSSAAAPKSVLVDPNNNVQHTRKKHPVGVSQTESSAVPASAAAASHDTARDSIASQATTSVNRHGLQIELPSDVGSKLSGESGMLAVTGRDWGDFERISGGSSGMSTASPGGYLLGSGGARMQFSATVAPNQLQDVQKVLEAFNLASKLTAASPAAGSGRISVATVDSGGFSETSSTMDGFVEDGELFGHLAVGHLLDMVGQAAGDKSLAANNFHLAHVRSLQHPSSGRRRLVVSTPQESPLRVIGASPQDQVMVVDISPQAAASAVSVADQQEQEVESDSDTCQDDFFVHGKATEVSHAGPVSAPGGYIMSPLPSVAQKAATSAAARSSDNSNLDWLQAYATLAASVPAVSPLDPDVSRVDSCSSNGSSVLVLASRADTMPLQGTCSTPIATAAVANRGPAHAGAADLDHQGRGSNQQGHLARDSHGFSAVGHGAQLGSDQQAAHTAAHPVSTPIKGILKKAFSPGDQRVHEQRPFEAPRILDRDYERGASHAPVQQPAPHAVRPLSVAVQPNSRPQVPRLPAAQRRQAAKLAAHKAARRCIRCRSFLAVASLIQIWAGLAGVALAIFLFTGLYTPETPLDQPDVAVAKCPVSGCETNSTSASSPAESSLSGLDSEQLGSISTFGVGFTVLIILGILGNYAARWKGGLACGCLSRHQGVCAAASSALLWLLAVSMETATAVWMVTRDMPFASEGILLVLAMQALPFCVALAALGVLACHSQVTPAVQQQVGGIPDALNLDDTTDVSQQKRKELLEVLGGSKAALGAVLRVQAVFRGQLGRARAARARELAAWKSLTWQRWSLQCLVYLAMVSIVAAGVYALLLFGSRFTFAQGIAWSRAVVLAFLFDICIQQPILAFIWVSYKFVLASIQRPAQVVILERLASNARAAQVLLEAALIRDEPPTVRRAAVRLPNIDRLSSQQLLTIDAALSAPQR